MMPSFDCATDTFSCMVVGLIGVITLAMMILGTTFALRSTRVSADGAANGVQRLVVIVLLTMMVWHWMLHRGNPWWFFFGLPLLLTILFFAFALPLALSIAVATIVRKGTHVSASVRRLVLTFALIPAMYMLIFQSGLWPTRTTEAA